MAKKPKRKSTAKKTHKSTKTPQSKKLINKKHINRTYIYVIAAGLLALLILILVGQTIRSSSQPYYVGMDKCVSCHEKEFEKMESSSSMKKMMAAINLLQGEDINNPRCLGCHTTGYGKKWDESVPFEERVSVQCEACHGPGSEYIKFMELEYSKNNQDLRNKAVKAGLIISPQKNTCFQCHHDGDIGPDGKPIIWDFEKHKSLILH